MKTHLFMLAILMAGAGPAHAIVVAGSPGVAAAAVTAPPSPKPGAAVDESHALREGTITAISEKGDQIQVSGSWLKLADGATRIFRGGRLVLRSELAKGQTVRFTLSRSDRSTLGVVYVP